MKNVLIVDDSRSILSIVTKEIVRVVDANIVTAKSLQETLKIIEEIDFHIAVIDVNLPDSEHGEVIDLMLEKDVPVVVLAGSMDTKTKKIILEKSILEYVVKTDRSTIVYTANIVKRILKNYDEYVLLVDDTKTSRMFLRMYLEALKLNVIEVSSAEDALEIIDSKEYKFSLILTDYEMSGMNGMDLTVALRCKYSKENLSIIAVSGADSSNIATSFLRYGANDFIKKPYTQEELTARINVNLDLINLFKKSKDDANKDFLTGLYNRRFLFDSGEKIVSKNRRKNKNVAVVMLDIDFFKKINDTYGHDVGDKAIKQIQVILHKKLRESDLVCRVGGEEFCMVLEDVSSSDIEKKFEIVRKSFEDNIIEIGSISFSYTVSIGICYGMLNSLEDMITEADNALYTAKNSGRNKVILNII